MEQQPTQLNEKELNLFKQWLKGCLAFGPVTVTFTKKDGTERQMHCTLSESRIPTDKQPKTQQSASDSGSALRVFDTDKGEWRSFRWDSITNVTFSIGESND